MTANAPRIKATATPPGTVPAYNPHAQEQLPGEGFRSIGDYTSSGDYTSTAGPDVSVDRSTWRHSLRRLMRDQSRSDISGWR